MNSHELTQQRTKLLNAALIPPGFPAPSMAEGGLQLAV
jgi:hypothetical protein